MVCLGAFNPQTGRNFLFGCAFFNFHNIFYRKIAMRTVYKFGSNTRIDIMRNKMNLGPVPQVQIESSLLPIFAFL